MIESMKKWASNRTQSLRDRIGCRLLGIHELPPPPILSGERLIVDLGMLNMRAIRHYSADFPCAINETINVVLGPWAYDYELNRGEKGKKC